MDLTFAAIVIMSGWVVAMVAAGLAMALRPGGVAVHFAPAGAPLAAATGRRDEILLGGEAEVLGNVRGTVRAVQLGPENRFGRAAGSIQRHPVGRWPGGAPGRRLE